MKSLLFALALVAGLSTTSFASELDNDNAVANQKFQGTMVIRVDKRTQTVSALHTNSDIKSEAQAQALTQKNFKPVAKNQVRTELDQDGGASSWYFYHGYNYNYGYSYQMNWYGTWYNPCYTYNYGYYNYYYYNNWGWNWNWR